MRETKFRAWDKENKKMLPIERMDFGLDGHGFRVFCNDGTNYWWIEDNYDFEVMQYIGIKDKNDKEDWIDDIVKVKVGPMYYHRKIYQADTGAYCIDLPSTATTYDIPILLISIEHENVGNKYENKDLISG